jgi:hypothetical protein
LSIGKKTLKQVFSVGLVLGLSQPQNSSSGGDSAGGKKTTIN